MNTSPISLFLGGAVAISAMLLPGISGSFILLLLGLYPHITSAVHDKNIAVILWVALGCIAGLLLFSRFLNWLLSRWFGNVMACMLGVIAGALIKVWPWQAGGVWYFPHEYAVNTGHQPYLLAVIALFCVSSLGTYFLYLR